MKKKHFQCRGKKTSLVMHAVKLILFLVLAAGCTDQNVADSGNAGRKKITDCAGREVALPAKVEKVVDLALLDGTRTSDETPKAMEQYSCEKCGYIESYVVNDEPYD